MVTSTAKVFVAACVAILLRLQPLTATSDFFSPFISPILDSVCKQVDICGKGTCKASNDTAFSFECECDHGWKQARPEDDEDHQFKFLPCIIPNCTINQSCATGSSSVQQKAKQDDDSILDPCHWADCGGGSCNKTSAFSYSCLCDGGYANLLNISSLPCYKDCSIGLDCSNLGITMTNQSTSASPAVGEMDESAGRSIVQGRSLCWIMGLLISMAAVT